MGDQATKRRDAFRLANELHHDLVTAPTLHTVVQTLFDHSAVPDLDTVRVAVTRMCLFHAVLTLAKWTELYDRYRDTIPAAVADRAKDLRKEIQRRGIVDFRNNVVGHVWDDERHRALTNAEVEQRIIAFVGGGVADFLAWAGDPSLDDDLRRPVFVIEQVRDAFKSSYGFTDSDLNA